ncbi:DUF84 family protein [Metabacillus sp. FJAT-52054]|uniref:inosine/xanthosine triphosphatase n=1 Tax=Metabacillus sediminis TaxID=3117746 RepID=A0ABZ2NF78_9BACI
MIVSIGTTNPAKVRAVKLAFAEIDLIQEFIEADVSSGVSSQPFSDEETMKGAINRAEASRKETGADIGIGLEGGVVETSFGFFLCNWGALTDGSLSQPIVAGGARIQLPLEIGAELVKGRELSDVMDEFSHRTETGKNEGAMGIFTNGAVDRTEMFAHVVKLLAGRYQYEKSRQSL